MFKCVFSYGYFDILLMFDEDLILNKHKQYSENQKKMEYEDDNHFAIHCIWCYYKDNYSFTRHSTKWNGSVYTSQSTRSYLFFKRRLPISEFSGYHCTWFKNWCFNLISGRGGGLKFPQPPPFPSLRNLINIRPLSVDCFSCHKTWTNLASINNILFLRIFYFLYITHFMYSVHRVPYDFRTSLYNVEWYIWYNVYNVERGVR